MKYTLNYLDDKNIVEVKIRERINFQSAEQFSKEALKLAKDNNCTKFLIDHSDTIIHGNTTNYHSSGADLQQFGFSTDDKIAFIIKDLISNSRLQNIEEGNATWSSSKYFSNNEIEKAVDWLLN